MTPRLSAPIAKTHQRADGCDWQDQRCQAPAIPGARRDLGLAPGTSVQLDPTKACNPIPVLTRGGPSLVSLPTRPSRAGGP